MNRRLSNIRGFKDDFTREVEQLLKDYPYGRYNEDPFLDKQKSSIYTTQIILEDCRDNLEATLLNMRTEGCVGLICIHKSKWDTDLTGFGVAIVKHLVVKNDDFDSKVKVCLELLVAAEEWFKKQNIRFVFLRVPGRDLAVVNALCKTGYLYIENWAYNSFDLSRPLPELDKKYRLRTFNPKEDLECILNFIKGAFVTQRYHADPYFGYDLAEKLYSKWIHTSIDSKEDYIVALEDSSKTLGFLIYGHKDLSQQLGIKFSRWKSTIIDPSERGKGIGKQLFITTLKLNSEEGCQIVDSSISANNIHSLNLHNRVGFRIISNLVTFHYWLPLENQNKNS